MNLEEDQDPPHILVAPLDWGLGHATRCIPVINSLLEKGCRITLAGEGRIQSLLQKEFPKLQFLKLKGYGIRYAKSRWMMPFKIAAQIPQILGSIMKEQEWIQNAAQELKIDGIISDNRYGLYHKQLPSVFLTHQLLVKTPGGNTIDNLLQKLNYAYINRFSFCWVPDVAGPVNLAGALSHPKVKPQIPLFYIGPLSRFSQTLPADKIPVLIILSGPEPQRTIFEKKIAEELKKFPPGAVVVRGLPGKTASNPFPSYIKTFDHLPTKELEKLIAAADYIVGRCGYSSVMDYVVMRKKTILIPTPGQTEQEYLGGYLMKNNVALCIQQSSFRLQPALELAASFPFAQKQINGIELESAIDHFLEAVVLTRKSGHRA